METDFNKIAELLEKAENTNDILEAVAVGLQERKKGRYSYFRLPFKADGNKLAFAGDGYASNHATGYGLSMLPNDPAGVDGKIYSLTGEEPPAAGSCPFSGQSLRRAALVPDGVGGSSLKISL